MVKPSKWASRYYIEAAINALPGDIRVVPEVGLNEVNVRQFNLIQSIYSSILMNVES